MPSLKLYGDFLALGHRGGIGSLQRLAKRFMPVEWVAEKDARVGLFWNNGQLTPERLASFKGYKVVYGSGNYVPCMCPEGASTRKFNDLTARVAAVADAFSHTSLAHREFVVGTIAPSLAKKPWAVLPPTFDPATYRPGPPVAELRVVAVAFWRDWFRWITIFEAFARVLAKVPGSRLILAGGWLPGVMDTQKRVATELNVLKAIDWVYEPDRTCTQEDEIIAAACQRGTVFVHSRFADWGTLTCVEALASGLPVIHGDVGGMPEFVGDCGKKLSFRAPMTSPTLALLDPLEIADAVLELHAKRAELRPLCIERARQFAAPVVYAAYTKWIRECAKL